MLSGSWVPPLVVALQVLTLLVMLLLVMTSPVGVVTEGRESSGGWDVGIVPSIATAVLWLVGTGIFRVPAAVLIACSGLWRGGRRSCRWRSCPRSHWPSRS